MHRLTAAASSMNEEEQRHVLAHALRVATMGNLVASIVHELSQPLTAVLSNAEAAERFLGCDPPNVDELREILSDIVEDNRRAVEVLRRLWSVFRASPVEPTDVDLNLLVVEVLKIVGNDARLKDVKLEGEFAGDLPIVRADRIQVQQVLLNLVVNGIDAMTGPDFADRRLSIRTTYAETCGVRVEVTDRGTGIDPGGLDRIFQPYFTTKSSGLGMGLSIAKSIVEAHRGTLDAANNPDAGATFTLTLPLAR